MLVPVCAPVPLCVCACVCVCLNSLCRQDFALYKYFHYHYDHTIPIYYTIKIKTPDSTCKSDLQLMLPTADSSFSVGHRELATRATHSGTWTAVNSPLSIAASRLQTETQNINKSVLTHSATGHAQWYLDCCQKKAHSPLPLPVYKQKHKTLTKEC